MVECDPNSLFCYIPNKGAPIAFSILYGISAVTHWYQCWRYKAKYTIPLGVGTTLTTFGFAFKVWASRDTDNLGAWITSTVLLFVAPPIYAAADYFIFAKTLHYVPSYAPMNPSRVVTTFVAADALCEMLNSTGIGQLVNYDNPIKVRIGSGLIRAGLILQVVLFFGFVAVVMRFHRNVRKAGLHGAWITVLYVLYVSSFLISVRCIYRVVEFFEVSGTIYHTEAYFHVFEATLMYLNVLILNLFHPGRFLPKHNGIYLDSTGQEVESADDRGGWDDDRPWYITLFDPFNIQGLANDYKERRAAKKHAAEGTQKV